MNGTLSLNGTGLDTVIENRFAGVSYIDADGNDAGQPTFEGIANIVPYFTPGTKIANPQGERRIGDLRAGDRVITRDNGLQQIRRTGACDLTVAAQARATHLRPVLIPQGIHRNTQPKRDTKGDPGHRMPVAHDKTALFSEEREVPVAAKYLTGREGGDVVEMSATTYIHIMLDRHEVILSGGTWTEGCQPGDHAWAANGDAQWVNIFELFPEPEAREGVDKDVSARPSLEKARGEADHEVGSAKRYMQPCAGFDITGMQ